MCPRKSHLKIPKWRVKQFQQKRNKMLSGPYTCPNCNKEKLQIEINAKKKDVAAFCECGLERSFKYVSIYDPVDYYNKIIDESTS